MGTKKKQQNGQGELVDLTHEELMKLAKPRGDFVEFVEPLLQLYEAHHSGPSPKGIDPAAIRAEVRAYEAMDAVVEKARLELEKEEKTRALHASNSWRGTLNVYKWAVYESNNNDEIKRGIDRFRQFMKTPRRKKAKPGTPPTAS